MAWSSVFARREMPLGVVAVVNGKIEASEIGDTFRTNLRAYFSLAREQRLVSDMLMTCQGGRGDVTIRRTTRQRRDKRRHVHAE